MNSGTLLNILFVMIVILFAFVSGAVISLIMQLRKTLGKAEKAIENLDNQLGPLLKKIDSSFEHINSISLQFDEGLHNAGQALKSVKELTTGIKKITSLLSAESLLRGIVRSSVWAGIKAATNVLKNRSTTKRRE